MKVKVINKNTKKTFPKLLLIILIAIIVVVGSIGIVLLVVNKNNKENNNNNNAINDLPEGKKDDPEDIIKEDRLVIKEGYKTNYFVDDKFEKPTIFIDHGDNTFDDISKSKMLTFSGYDMSQAGDYTVIVTYQTDDIELTIQYNIVVSNLQVVKIVVNFKQKDLVWGETIDRSKIEVTAYYDDSSKEVVTDYQLNYDNKPEQYGEVPVIVSYRGVSKECSINVVEKPIDEQYKLIEDEAILLLGRFGVSNPTSPMNYEFDIDSKDTPKIKFMGVLDSNLNTYELQSVYLLTNIFYDYEFISGPEDSIDLIFPSKKIVLHNEERGISVSFYITSLFGEIKYTVVVTELIQENV